ncbi:hypothetical protein PG988_014221 [Apiospora saccharicola]
MGKKRPAAEVNNDQDRNGDAEKCCVARETMMLDPEGDVTITINCPRCDEARRFRASSQVLSLASPVFAKMLGPNFKEGHHLQNKGQVTISLHDDDPDAAEMVLCALHYYFYVKPTWIWHTQLVPMAFFSDKFDCSQALAPWISHWCQLSPPISVSKAAYTLLAAYLFPATNFYRISSGIVMHLPPNFAASWKKLENLDLLPEHLTSTFSTVVTDKFKVLHRQLQMSEGILRTTKGYFAIKKLQWVCTSCEHREERRRICQLCSRELVHQERTCTTEYRVSEYFRILRNCELWPSIDPFSTCTLSELSARISRAHKVCKHRCEADQSCPLRERLKQLWDHVDFMSKLPGGVHIDGNTYLTEEDGDMEDEGEEDSNEDADEDEDEEGEEGEDYDPNNNEMV